MRGYRWSRLALVAGLGLAVLAGGAPAWSKGSRSKENGTALWIAADRVVGFVPFTVSLYGRVNSSVEPDRLQLCREAAMQADFADARDSRGGGDPSALPSRHDRNDGPAEPPCSTGTLVRTPDGYDYKHEMRFDRPGTYRVRLSMVDRTGHKAISNAVQVNAF
jgi:hypothetical protein